MGGYNLSFSKGESLMTLFFCEIDYFHYGRYTITKVYKHENIQNWK